MIWVKKGCRIIIMLCVLAMGRADVSRAAGAADQPRDIGFTMQITVSMVEVTATVVDRSGRTVHGLEQDDFVILENGKPQEIIHFTNARGLPKRVLILLDVSGSMRIRDKIGVAKRAVEALINVLKPEDEVSLLFFADGDLEQAVPYSVDRDKLLNALWEVPAYGQTALRDAVEKAPRYSSAKGNYQRALLLITDGIDNASTVTLENAVSSARKVDLPIYTIGLDPAGRKTVSAESEITTAVESMSILSDDTGGRFNLVQSSAEIRSAMDQMIKDLENQYLIVFKSEFTGKGGEHKIEVQTRSRRYNILARRGYFVSSLH